MEKKSGVEFLINEINKDQNERMKSRLEWINVFAKARFLEVEQFAWYNDLMNRERMSHYERVLLVLSGITIGYLIF